MPGNSSSTKLLLVLAAINALGAFGIDMILPAHSETASSLGVEPDRIALIISAFLAGFAISPLITGPCSDRLGRKPVLVAALAAFTIASVLCAISPNFECLILSRFLQGLGGGASRPVLLAIIRDSYKGSEARSKLSFMGAVSMCAPLVAPTLGSLLLIFGSWRIMYLVLSAYGVTCLLMVIRNYRESLAQRLPSLALKTLLAGYLGAAREPQFVAGTIVTSASFGAIFAYVAAAPELFIEGLGLSTHQFGVLFGLCSIGLIVGALANGKLNARRIAPSTLLLGGTLLATTGSGGLAACAYMQVIDVWPWAVAIVFLMASAGIVSGNATQMALVPFKQYAGSASALMSAMQMAVASLSGFFVSALPFEAMGTAMVITCLLFQLLMIGGILWLVRAQKKGPDTYAESLH